jgi:ATP-dependent Clp protease protease subunit
VDVSIGNAKQLRTDAALLDKLGGSIVDAYTKKTGASKDQVLAWMAAETWFTAAEAKDEGFIDAIDGQSDAEASFDLSVFAHAPAALVHDASEEPGPRDLERALREAGCSRAVAKAILAGGLKTATTPREAADDDVLEAGRRLLAAFKS